MTPAGCQGARSLTNLTPYACSYSQTPSQRIFKSFKPRISIAWIIKPKKQLVTAFPNTKAIYFSLPTTLCTLCLSFARPNISNFLYEHGNKEEITSKNRVTQIALTCGSGFDSRCVVLGGIHVELAGGSFSSAQVRQRD